MIERKHPLVIRWAHWVNFPVLSIMIWSGLLIYWANDVYRVGVGSLTLFHFFPAWFNSALHLDGRLAEGMAIHFLFMWFFTLNGLAYLLYTLFSGEWRYLFPDRNSFREASQVMLYDLGLRKELPPQTKYNGAQKIAYTAILVMGFGSVVTGLSIYKPTQVAWLTTLLGGYQMGRFLHFWLTMGYVAFFGIHIAQVIRAGWNNFRAMVTGYEVAPASGGIGVLPTKVAPPSGGTGRSRPAIRGTND